MLEVETWELLPIPKTFNLQTELSKDLFFQDSVRKSFESIFSFESFMNSNIFCQSVEKPRESFGIHARISIQQNAPVFSMTGMNVLKILRSYIELTSVLSPLSFEVFYYLAEILDFYVYEILLLFSTSERKQDLVKEIPPIERCQNDPGYFHSLFLFQSKYRPVQVHMFRMEDLIGSLSGELDSSIKSLHSKSNIATSLTKALVALESYRNLVSSLEIIKDLRFSLTEEEFSQIERFLSGHSELSASLTSFILEPLLNRNLELSWLRPFIERSKWSEESYQGKSGFLIKLMKYFKEFCLVVNNPLIVPPPAKAEVMELLVSICSNEIIESFSLVQHLSASGRAQMKKDFRCFWKKAKKTANVPRPNEELKYLQIWHSDLQDVVDWVLENTEISLNRQTRLLKSLPAFFELSEKEKKRILTKVQNFYLKQIFL